MAISHLKHLSSDAPKKLRNRHQRRLRQYLLDDVDANLFAISWLENRGIESHRPEQFAFWGWFDGRDRLCAVALDISKRLLMLDVRDTEFARGFGHFFRHRQTRFLHVVSRAQYVEPFWEAYTTDDEFAVDARLIQHQTLYRLLEDDYHPEPTRPSAIRRARLAELDPIFLASVKMHREETLEDPLARDASAFRRHVRYRIENGRTFAWFDNQRRLLFKADISTRCSEGAQISGVYTAPQFRNQGIATRAMCDVCSILFDEGLPRLTLYVNRSNASAIRVYEKLGFQSLGPYRTIFVDN